MEFDISKFNIAVGTIILSGSISRIPLDGVGQQGLFVSSTDVGGELASLAT